jgi:hypothetical protein
MRRNTSLLAAAAPSAVGKRGGAAGRDGWLLTFMGFTGKTKINQLIVDRGGMLV